MVREAPPNVRSELLDRVREAVRQVEPGARIILLGSRVRGTADAESDWDFLILLDGPVDWRRAEQVHDRLYDLELETGEALSGMVRGKDEWDGPLLSITPLHDEVEREGVPL